MKRYFASSSYIVIFFIWNIYARNVVYASDIKKNLSGSASSGDETYRQITKGEQWLATEKLIKYAASYVIRRIVRRMDPEDMSKISNRCLANLMKTAAGLRQAKIWAFRILDTMGKVPNGLSSGRITALGDFDGCLDINVTGHFQGKYCILEVRPPLPETKPFVGVVETIPELENVTDPESFIGAIQNQIKPYYNFFVIRTAVCVPSSCTERDIEFMAKKVMEVIRLEWKVRATNCQVKEDVVLETDDFIAITVVSVILFMATCGTTVDLILLHRKKSEAHRNNSGFPVSFLLCFSVWRNTQRLLKPDKSDDSIKIFHGMRVVTILWVVLNHTYAIFPVELAGSVELPRKVEKDFAFQPILNGFHSVDTFFFMSAVLVVYGRLTHGNKKFSIFFYIFRRIWRLIPPVLFVMAFQLLVYRMGSGPFWVYYMGRMVQNCRERWWTNVVQAVNFVDDRDSCLGWTWYVAADIQLYVLALLVILPLIKYPKIALSILSTLTIVGVAVIAANHILYDLPPILIVTRAVHEDEVLYSLKYGYYRPHVHLVTYCIGMAVGYLLHSRRKQPISTVQNAICWVIFCAMGMAAVYSGYAWYIAEKPTVIVATVYVIVCKVAWALALGWVTFSCFQGSGGFVTKLLSWSPFVTLSRLTYMVYLVHPIILVAYNSSSRIVIQTNHKTFVSRYLALVLSSFVTAYALSMLFESPFGNLEKVLFSDRNSKFQAAGNEHKITMSDEKSKL